MDKTIESAMAEARARLAARKAQAEELFRRTPPSAAVCVAERNDNEVDAYDIHCFIRSRTDVTPEMVATHFNLPLAKAQWMMV